MATARWDGAAHWDGGALWGGPDTGWGDRWEWWIQRGHNRVATITDCVVEARWTTDAYTPGDGTWRGDLVPGRLTLQLLNRDGRLDQIDELAAVWATFHGWGDGLYPKGFTWCWFVDTVARRFVAPGDPQGHDVVLSASPWPARLTTGSYGTARPAEVVTGRIQALAVIMDADAGLVLPAVANELGYDTHVAAAIVPATAGTYPPWLQLFRDAAANGILSWTAVQDQGGQPGRLVLGYVPMGVGGYRLLRGIPHSQVVAGTISTSGTDTMVTHVQWTGTDPAGVATTVDQLGGGWGAYGVLPRGPMRILGDLAGADRAAVTATGTGILNANGSPNTGAMASLSCTSGRRTGPTGGPPSAPWDPQWMAFAPTDTLRWVGPPGPTDQDDYRVVSTSHRLNARVWEAVHTLVRDAPATALPNP